MSPRSSFIALTVLALPAGAEPLYDQDNGPLSGIYNFVDSTEGANLLPHGRIATDKLEIGFELPYIRHSEGSLDSLIDTWHDVFDLPGGNRETRDTDLIEFRYANADGDQLNVFESSNGIGDARFTAGWKLGDNPNHARALRFAVTLPTGEARDLHGTDAVTVGMGYAGDVQNMTAAGRLSLYYRLHATWVDTPAVLPEFYNEWIAHAAAGFGYAATDWLELRAQVLARSATHNVEIPTLGESSWILSFGGSIRLGEIYELSLSVGEDIKVESSPDVSFQLSLRYRPGS